MDALLLWDAKNGALIRTLTGEQDTGAVTFSLDSSMVAVAASNAVYIWDTATGALIQSLEHAPSLAFSLAFGEGDTLAVGHGTVPESFEWTHGVRLWDVRNWSPTRDLFPLSQVGDICDSVAFSPDGRMLATGLGDGSLKVWDSSNWKILRSLKPKMPNGICSVAFTPDGKMLAATSGSTLRFWSPGQGKLLGEFNISDGSDTWSPFGSLGVFNPYRHLIATTTYGNFIQVWSVKIKQ
jgi:WD40 repeat protein